MKRIVSIAISNSSFFASPTTLKFSKKLNCIMGGRGAGKSTILHFLLAGLTSTGEDNKLTYSILKNNLEGGVLTIVMEDEEGKQFKIVKSLDEQPQAYSLPGEKDLAFRLVKNRINCDFYKSQAIEEIGKSPIERLDLIDKMLGAEKAPILQEIEGLQADLEENAKAIKSQNTRIKQLDHSLQQYEGVDVELKKLKEEKPGDLDKQEQKDFEIADKNEKLRTAEKRYIKMIKGKLGDINENIENEQTELKETIINTSKHDVFLNTQLLGVIKNAYVSTLKESSKLFIQVAGNVEKALAIIDQNSQKLDQLHLKQHNEFSKLKQRFEKHKQFYTKWNGLTKKEDEKKSFLEDKKKEQLKRDKLKKNRKELVERLTEKTRELFDLRKSKVKELNAQFAGSVKITLNYGGITDDFEQELRNALKGSNMRYNAIIPLIVSNFTPSRFAEIIHTRNLDALKVMQGIDNERAAALLTALSETDALYDLEMICCPDYPEFLLKIDEKSNAAAKSKEYYKRSDDLSTGQRCTTVLPIIFAVSQNPLIIDQPEDNLDNKYISDTVHKIIVEQKENRQLIFITHNPNIPVLADAEHNFFLNYKDKKSAIADEGNIDDVKINILNLMEGGKDAFKRRKELYQEELQGL
jgi:ABC-type lipoprotein export system ATPase subunit